MHNTPFYFVSSGVEIPVLQLGRLIVRKTYTSSMNMLIRDTPCDHCDHQLSNVSLMFMAPIFFDILPTFCSQFMWQFTTGSR